MNIFRYLHILLPRKKSDRQMIQQKILSAYESLAEKYNELIDHKPHNAYYDRPNTLALFPDVQGKKILDAACGPGKYAEILIEKGATVTGFDISPNMVQKARERNRLSEEFFVHDLTTPFTMFPDGSFDIVLCALALEYVEDWTNTIREFNRVLVPGGLLIISITHPFFDYNFFNSERYFEVEEVSCVWKGFGTPVEVISYRRSLGACLEPLTENGFFLDKLVEPLPVAEFEKLDPRHFRELNAFPSFLCLRAVKK
ncbi:MAG TPA: class I SAM-dependent methyltransferase [Saprospirales bacterium]|nr:class I SAM-dependent methyltransferase [Saprospirales bacterium]